MKALLRYFPNETATFLGWGIASAVLKTGLFIALHYFIIALHLHEEHLGWIVWAFIALLLSFTCEHIYYIRAASLFQELLYEIKNKAVNQLLKLPLIHFEQMGKTEIYATLLQTTGVILHNAAYLPVSLLNGYLSLFFITLYIGIVSAKTALLFFIWLLIMVTLVSVSLSKPLIKARMLQEKTRSSYLHSLNNVLHGFKELKINHRKKKAVLLSHSMQSRHLGSVNASLTYIDRNRGLVMEIGFFLFLSFLVFVVGKFSGSSYREAMPSLLLLFFMSLRSIATLLMTIEDWQVVNHAMTSLLSLIKQMKERAIKETASIEGNGNVPMLKRTLNIENLYFSYPETGGFSNPYSIGPISISIQKGDCIFIVGGNGSGKSTLLKVITQLYQQQRGTIAYDDIMVIPKERKAYQGLFSTIFTDFHLFDKAYGLNEIDEAHTAHLLHLFDIDARVSFDGVKFSFTGLSTGQRKRLAMLYAFLEKRSIYIFDEVAADQDPTYRKFFYEIVLPDLKKSGRTVIAVTHDDHYFHIADKVFEMKQGMLTPYNPK